MALTVLQVLIMSFICLLFHFLWWLEIWTRMDCLVSSLKYIYIILVSAMSVYDFIILHNTDVIGRRWIILSWWTW